MDDTAGLVADRRSDDRLLGLRAAVCGVDDILGRGRGDRCQEPWYGLAAVGRLRSGARRGGVAGLLPDPAAGTTCGVPALCQAAVGTKPPMPALR